MLGLARKSPDAENTWRARLRAGLERTRAALGARLGTLLGRRPIDESLFEELESALLMADCGVAASEALIARLRARAKEARIEDGEALKGALKDCLAELLAPLEHTLDAGRAKPCVIVMAGVNGAGKTTSIGKLAKWLQSQGKSVLLAAGDTFRAAAHEQLVAWGERNGVAVIGQHGGDPGAVVFDALTAARARNVDVLIADTAGRLPTQLHLMEEIKKVRRVIAKAYPGAPHETLLVLDANTGQNAIAQVKAFDDALGLTGLVLTKLDGTAKGGVVCAIAHVRSTAAHVRSTAAHVRSTAAHARSTAAHVRSTAAHARSAISREYPVPLVFVGVGEGIDDLRPFVARDFAEALVD